ncbi:MAG: voltage-gated potassium channel protein [Terriglobales bacterium]
MKNWLKSGGWRRGLKHWFPHLPLALALAFAGLLVMALAYGRHIGVQWRDPLAHVAPAGVPFLLIGVALLLMSIGLALRSRFAWSIALLLAVATLLAVRLLPHTPAPLVANYVLLLFVALVLARRAFNRSSVAAGTLFAITSSILLLIYAVFGALYLGAEFTPPIRDAVTAFYYAVVTMGTVGYGDITPHTPHARLFTVSIIFLGIAVFATSISAIVGPLVSGSLNRIVNRKESRMRRTAHFIVVGLTPLAQNTYRELKRRGQSVLLIAPHAPEPGDFDPEDVIIGDANNLDVLRKANAGEAKAVLAMRSDDSENAFIALAVKELKGKAQTVVAVNDAKYMDRLKLVQPDVVIAPQVLGGEILAMALSGEPISGDYVLQRLLHFDSKA